MSNSQLNKLKLGIKNGIEVTLKISPNIAGDSNDENTFSHKSLLTSTQVSNLRKAFTSNFSTNVNLLKTQLHKIRQSEGLEPLLKSGLPLIENVLKPFPKSVLITLGLTAATSPTDAVIHNKMFGSGTR